MDDKAWGMKIAQHRGMKRAIVAGPWRTSTTFSVGTMISSKR